MPLAGPRVALLGQSRRQRTTTPLKGAKGKACRMKKALRVPIFAGILTPLALLALVVSLVQPVTSQGGAAPFIALQPTTPGTAQTGHGNITGTFKAGFFQGNGSGMTSLTWAALTGVPSTFPPGGSA